MGIRYREVAVKAAYNALSSAAQLNPESLGETYNNGKKLTENQLGKVSKHYQKILGAFKKKLDRMEERKKNRIKKKKESPKIKPTKEVSRSPVKKVERKK